MILQEQSWTLAVFDNFENATAHSPKENQENKKSLMELTAQPEKK